MTGAVPLLHVFRGATLESVHRGALVVVEAGREILVRGRLDRPIYFRSTSKPFQALVGVTSGAVDAYGITPAELALAAGSHNTRPEHVAAAQAILDKAGVPEAALGCGGHYAFDPEIARRQRDQQDHPLPIWSNCSGKHALMLATARHLGLPLDTYLHPEHPVQIEIRRQIALFAGLESEAVAVGIDGCSAPAFAVPLDRMAHALARFGAPAGLPGDVADAARRVGAAMHAHPGMVAGPGRFDTVLMETAGQRLLAKAGAEGVHGVVAPDRSLGLAVKVEDGSDRGYRLVVLQTLVDLGLLTPEEAAEVARPLCDPVVRDLKGRVVGRLAVVPPTP